MKPIGRLKGKDLDWNDKAVIKIVNGRCDYSETTETLKGKLAIFISSIKELLQNLEGVHTSEK